MPACLTFGIVAVQCCKAGFPWSRRGAFPWFSCQEGGTGNVPVPVAATLMSCLRPLPGDPQGSLGWLIPVFHAGKLQAQQG